MSSVELIWITDDAEQVITDCARVSNPANQGKDGSKLIDYLMLHEHWSPLEMASACFKINTSLAIAPQILRHRSFSFQQFSRRYSSDYLEYEHVFARKQAEKNRQSSEELCDGEVQEWWEFAQRRVWEECKHFYDAAIAKGIAREQARYLLPAEARTDLFMTGTLRSWYHYCKLRLQEDTQLEHFSIAYDIGCILAEKCPHIFGRLYSEQTQDQGNEVRN